MPENKIGYHVQKQEDTLMACIVCGTTKDLCMIPHRDSLNHIVGYVVACDTDAESLYNKHIDIID